MNVNEERVKSQHRSMNTSHNAETFCLSFFLSRLSRPVTSSFSAFCSRSVQRSNCYMVCGADAVGPSSSSRSNSDLEIGCLIDLATGLVSFTANGKELSTTYQVNNNHTARTNAGQLASSTVIIFSSYRVFWVPAPQHSAPQPLHGEIVNDK